MRKRKVKIKVVYERPRVSAMGYVMNVYGYVHPFTGQCIQPYGKFLESVIDYCSKFLPYLTPEFDDEL